jgi:hypothetical protein
LSDDLRPFATPRQTEILDALQTHGSHGKAARALGCHKSLITQAIRSLRQKAAVQGFSPDHGLTEVIAPGYTGRGHSTMYRVDPATGKKEPVLQWVKTRADDAARQAFIDEAMAAAAESLPRVLPVAAPAASESRLLNLFTISDAHLGALCWHEEGGENWDLKIAEKTIVEAFGHMMATAPRAKVAVVNQLGDLLHHDSFKAVTPASGHLLDADGRFRKMARVAIRVLRQIIDMALASHDIVHVVCAEGNHDEASSGWLAELLVAVYENEPRITIDDSPLPYYRYRFGKVFLGFHHGHLRAKESLPLLFVQQFRDEWGATSHSYIHTGHRHHAEEKDVMGIRLVEHATLAARDAYAARHGYMAARQALVITYHQEYGEVARATVTPEMLF